MQIPVQALQFQIAGKPVLCKQWGSGHINYTLRIETDAGKRYILQRINQFVFKDPVAMVENANGVASFLLNKTGNPKASVRFLPTLTGDICLKDDQGEYWRLYEYIEGFCLDAPECLEDFYESAIAFGNFQNALSDYPVETLYETIPNFHNTPDRFRQLKDAIAADPKRRAVRARPEIEFALSQEVLGGTLQRMLEKGQLPLRVTHNDTKLNNVLLDPETRKSLCVLDLDTVMPGLSAFDFGDSIRFGAATTAEDDPEPENMQLDLERFAAYTRGYLTAAKALTDAEVQALSYGAIIMSLEVGIRFLTDYLNGDVYFRTAYPEHNLVRCRTQLALVADMLKKWDEMNDIVNRIAKEFR